jgi:hypothetical protein
MGQSETWAMGETEAALRLAISGLCWAVGFIEGIGQGTDNYAARTLGRSINLASRVGSSCGRRQAMPSDLGQSETSVPLPVLSVDMAEEVVRVVADMLFWNDPDTTRRYVDPAYRMRALELVGPEVRQALEWP